jgi:nucleoside-diphosphate-sugar epimerase
VRDLIGLISSVLGADVEVEADAQRIRPTNSEVERLWCDNTRIISNTNWKPAYTLRMGIEETAEWLQQNMQYYKPDIYNV